MYVCVHIWMSECGVCVCHHKQQGTPTSCGAKTAVELVWLCSWVCANANMLSLSPTHTFMRTHANEAGPFTRTHARKIQKTHVLYQQVCEPINSLQKTADMSSLGLYCPHWGTTEAGLRQHWGRTVAGLGQECPQWVKTDAGMSIVS